MRNGKEKASARSPLPSGFLNVMLCVGGIGRGCHGGKGMWGIRMKLEALAASTLSYKRLKQEQFPVRSASGSQIL